MTKFELILENKKSGHYHKLALFLTILNAAVFAVLAAYTSDKWVAGVCIKSIIVIAIFYIIEWLSRKRGWKPFSAANASLIYVVISWLIIMYWLPAMVSFLLWLFYNISRRPLLVTFSEESISYPSFPRKNLDWKQLSNTVLKDDLLTIDFKNNRILQQLIEKTAKSIDEKEFNDFCRIQLKKA